MSSHGGFDATGATLAVDGAQHAEDLTEAQKKAAKEEKKAKALAKRKAEKLAKHEALVASIRPKPQEFEDFIPEMTDVAGASSRNTSLPASNADGGGASIGVGDVFFGSTASHIPSFSQRASPPSSASVAVPIADISTVILSTIATNLPPITNFIAPIPNTIDTSTSQVLNPPSVSDDVLKRKASFDGTETITSVKRRRPSPTRQTVAISALSVTPLDAISAPSATPPAAPTVTKNSIDSGVPPPPPSSSLAATVANTIITSPSPTTTCASISTSVGSQTVKHGVGNSIVASPALANDVSTAPTSGPVNNNGVAAVSSPLFIMPALETSQASHQTENNDTTGPSWMTAKSPTPLNGGSQSSGYIGNNSFAPSYLPRATIPSNPTLPYLGPARYSGHNSFVPSSLSITTNALTPISHCAMVWQASRAVAVTPSPYPSAAAIRPSNSTTGSLKASTHAGPRMSPFSTSTGSYSSPYANPAYPVSSFSTFKAPYDDPFANAQTLNLMYEDMDGVLTEHTPLTYLPSESMEGVVQASEDDEMEGIAESSTSLAIAPSNPVESVSQTSIDVIMDEETSALVLYSDTAMSSAAVNDGLDSSSVDNMDGITSCPPSQLTTSILADDGLQGSNVEAMHCVDACPLSSATMGSTPIDSDLQVSNNSNNESVAAATTSTVVSQQTPAKQDTLNPLALAECVSGLKLNLVPALKDAQRPLPAAVPQPVALPSSPTIAGDVPVPEAPVPIPDPSAEGSVHSSTLAEPLTGTQKPLPALIPQAVTLVTAPSTAGNVPTLEPPVVISAAPTEVKMQPSNLAEPPAGTKPDLDIEAIEEMLHKSSSPTTSLVSSSTASKIPVPVVPGSSPKEDKKISKSKIPAANKEIPTAATMVSVNFSGKKMGEVAGEAEETRSTNTTPQVLEAAPGPMSTTSSVVAFTTHSQAFVFNTQPKEITVVSKSTNKPRPTRLSGKSKSRIGNHYVPKPSVANMSAVSPLPVSLANGTSIAVQDSLEMMEKKVTEFAKTTIPLTCAPGVATPARKSVRGSSAPRIPEKSALVSAYKQESSKQMEKKSGGKEEISNALSSHHGYLSLLDGNESKIYGNDLPQSNPTSLLLLESAPVEPTSAADVEESAIELRKQLNTALFKNKELMKDKRKLEQANLDLKSDHEKELANTKKKAEEMIKDETSHFRRLCAEELVDAEELIELANQTIKDQAFELEQMRTKTNKNRVLMVNTSTQSSTDLKPITKSLGVDVQEFEFPAFNMVVQDIEVDRSGLGMETKRLGENLALPELIVIFEEPESYPILSATPDFATKKECFRSIESIASRTMGLPSDERKKELFAGQGFTPEELIEIGDDTDLMGDILLGFATDCDNEQPAPRQALPLSRKAWRKEQGLTSKPLSHRRKRSSFSACNELLNMFYIAFAVFAVLSYLITPSLKVEYPNTIERGILSAMEPHQPIYNAPISLTWANGASDLSDMISCFPGDEPVFAEPVSVDRLPIHCEKLVVRHWDPGYVLFQWMKAAWRCGCAKRGLVGVFCSAPRRF